MSMLFAIATHKGDCKNGTRDEWRRLLGFLLSRMRTQFELCRENVQDAPKTA